MNLSRITSTGRFIPQVDGLRFIAISAVVLYHTHGFLGGYVHPCVFSYGWRGVHLFFVLSGFILGLPFAQHYLASGDPVNVGRFYLRRFTRLEPPYVINVLLLAMWEYVVHDYASGPNVLATLTYTHNAFFGLYSTISPVTWSLEVEIQFYLLMPLLARLYGLRHRRAALLLITAAFSVARVMFDYPRVNLSIVGNLQFFTAGMLLADLYTSGLPKESAQWDIVTFGWPIVFLFPGKPGAYFMAALPFVALALYTAAFSGRNTSKILSLHPFTAIGGMCYSIYLWHYLLLNIVRHFTANPYVLYSAGIPMVLIPSTVYFLLIERPCMRRDWPQRLISSLRPGGAADRQLTPLQTEKVVVSSGESVSEQ